MNACVFISLLESYTGGAFFTVSAAEAGDADLASSFEALVLAPDDESESAFEPSLAKNLSMLIMFLRKPHLASSARLCP